MTTKISWAPALFLAAVLLAQCGRAQTPGIPFSISPATNNALIELTTNLFTVTISNPSNYTNVLITATAGTANLTFRDSGSPPDAVTGDGIYSANFIPPKVVIGTNITFRFTVSGDDLTDPMNPVSSTSIVSRVYQIVARPENDNFTNATKIAVQNALILATNNYASLQAGEPQHALVASGDASVWWMWSSLVTTNVLMDLAGTSFNPVLAVYSGSTIGTLVPVASATNDTFNHLKPYVVFQATAGTTYRIAVSGYTSNEVGNIRMRILPGGAPDKVGPVVTILNPAAETLVTVATNQVQGTAKDRFNDTGISQVFLQVNSSTPTLASGTTNWSGTVNLPPGTNVVRAFAIDYAGNTGIVDQVVIRFVNPTNDLFVYATPLVGVGGTMTAINGRATKEPGEPNHAGNDGGHSIWYSFTSPLNGNLSVTITTNTTFDTLLAIYTGDSMTNLSLVASNDDATGLASLLTINVTNQTTYYIALDGYGGSSGSVEFQYAFTTSDRFFTVSIDPPLGGGVTPGSGLYLADSTIFFTATPQRDFTFVGWQGTINSTANPLIFKLTQNMNLSAQFKVTKYTDGFESIALTNLPWASAGDAPWSTQTAVVSSGRFAARSGAITDGQTSSLVLTATTFENIGSFDYRVSSELGFDALEFYMNGNLLGRWSGETGWQTFQFHVLAGANNFEWRYTKDANFSQGMDAAFLDNLYLPIDLPSANSAAQLGILSLPNHQSQIQIQGQVNRTYVVQSSTNLIAWSSVLTNVATNGAFSFTETQQLVFPQKFYRALAK